MEGVATSLLDLPVFPYPLLQLEKENSVYVGNKQAGLFIKKNKQGWSLGHYKKRFIATTHFEGRSRLCDLQTKPLLKMRL